MVKTLKLYILRKLRKSNDVAQNHSRLVVLENTFKQLQQELKNHTEAEDSVYTELNSSLHKMVVLLEELNTKSNIRNKNV